MIVAIDGPAGSGKSTVAREVAAALKLMYLNTGAMYRAIAWKAIQRGTDLDDGETLASIAEQSVISFEQNGERTFIDGKDVTEAIREPEVGQASSAIARISGVRRALVKQQQQIGAQGGLVCEGRDMTTVVFPNADVKIFLDASPETRARRRFLELQERGIPASFEDVLAEVRRRDTQDSLREDSPLRVAEDAVVLDTTDLSVGQVIRKVLEMANTCSSR